MKKFLAVTVILAVAARNPAEKCKAVRGSVTSHDPDFNRGTV